MKFSRINLFPNNLSTVIGRVVTTLLMVSVLFFLPVKQARAQHNKIPPFRILLSNGSYYTATQLPIKPLVLIYFSPDCEHCQKLMNELFPKLNQLKSASIVLATFKPVDEVADFERKYQTAKYSNMVVGTEGNTFFLRYYYKLMKTPFLALYDKNGNLVTAYREQPSVNDLITRLKQLK